MSRALTGVVLGVLVLTASARAEVTNTEWHALRLEFNRLYRKGQRLDAVARLASAPDVRATAMLLKLLDSDREDEAVRRKLVEVLSATRDPAGLGYLLKQLSRRRPIAATYDLLRAFGAMTGRPEHLAALVGKLEDDDPRVRVAAADALAGRPEKAIVDHLVKRLEDEAWQPAYAALTSLMKLGQPRICPALIERLPTRAGRQAADLRRALRSMGSPPQKDVAAWRAWWAKTGTFLPPGSRWRMFVSDRADAGAGTPRFFGLPVRSHSVAFVIDFHDALATDYEGPKTGLEDVPWSTVITTLQLIQHQLKTAIGALPAEAEVQLVLSGKSPRRWRSRPLPASEENKQAAVKWIDALSTERRLDPVGGLLNALAAGDRDPLSKRNMEHGPDTVYLVTAGRPDTGKLPYRKVTPRGQLPWADRLRYAIERVTRVRKVRLHIVGVGKPEDKLLARIAEASTGRYVKRAP